VDRIPYEKMWEDDRLWIPLLLEGVRFRGRYLFDGERMLDYELYFGNDADGLSM
jgi:8-oxo-dGTP diphosphatase